MREVREYTEVIPILCTLGQCYFITVKVKNCLSKVSWSIKHDDTRFVSRITIVTTMFITLKVSCSLNLLYTVGFYVCIFNFLVVKLGC